MQIVLDIDGTISDCRHRQHLAVARAWDEFHAELRYDDAIPNVFLVVHALLAANHNLIMLTGRPEEYRQETKDWFSSTCDWSEGEDYSNLLMRPKGDFRPDGILKVDLLDLWTQAMQVDKKNVLVLDDRDIVVEAMRNAGYTCFQTAQGAF